MSNEITVRSSLQVAKGTLAYQSQPTGFQATMVGSKGPSPGLVLALRTHTNVDLSNLSTPAWCRFMNIDPTTSANYVEIGLYDADVPLTFYPLLELLPGETVAVRLSRFLSQNLVGGTGTGLAAGTALRLAVKGVGGIVPVLVEAFDK